MADEIKRENTGKLFVIPALTGAVPIKDADRTKLEQICRMMGEMIDLASQLSRQPTDYRVSIGALVRGAEGLMDYVPPTHFIRVAEAVGRAKNILDSNYLDNHPKSKSLFSYEELQRAA